MNDITQRYKITSNTVLQQLYAMNRLDIGSSDAEVQHNYMGWSRREIG